MCMKQAKKCECGIAFAEMNFRDNVMPPDVVSRLFCPQCSGDVAFDAETMLPDNGWIIQYDMDVAEARGRKHGSLAVGHLTPEKIFDEGYATWLGVYPGDLANSYSERQELVMLSKQDAREYMRRMRTWAVGRMERLKEDGWRKARDS